MPEILFAVVFFWVFLRVHVLEDGRIVLEQSSRDPDPMKKEAS